VKSVIKVERFEDDTLERWPDSQVFDRDMREEKEGLRDDDCPKRLLVKSLATNVAEEV
jgi:hypothetical protein